MDGTHTPPPPPATPPAHTPGEPTHAGDTVAATPTPAVPAVNILPSTPPQPQNADPQPSLHSSVAPTSVPLPQSTSSLASTTSAQYPPHPDQGPGTTHPAEPSPFPSAAPAAPAPHTPVFAPTFASSPAAYAMQPMVPPPDAAGPSHVFTPAPIPEVVGSRRSSLHLAGPPLPPKPTPLPSQGPQRRTTRSPSPRLSYEPEAGPSRPLSVQTHSPFAMAGPYPLPTPAPSATAGSVLEPHVPRPARALSYAEGTPRARPDAPRRASHGASLSRFDRDFGVGQQRPTSGHSVNGSGVSVPPPEPIFGVGARPTQSRRTSRRSYHPGDGIEEDGDANVDESFSDTTTRTGERTAAERLAPTLKHAEDKLRETRLVARATGWSLNFAIGAQVVLGALTTGVAAATTGRQTSIATSVLGGLSTLAASYLAKARGSGEPEASTARAQDLENFVREARAWALDHGHRRASKEDDGGAALDRAVGRLRARFEEIMGAEQKGFGRLLHGEREKGSPV